MVDTPLDLIPSTDARLHLMCEPIIDITPEILDLANRMLATMYASNGCGLAAPQVGHNIRMIVMDCSENRKNPMVLINPQIILQEGAIEVTEGCLSFPGVNYRVKRSKWVSINALNHRGWKIASKLTGLWAICVQHEIDHLDGVTFDQCGTLIPPPGLLSDVPA